MKTKVTITVDPSLLRSVLLCAAMNDLELTTFATHTQALKIAANDTIYRTGDVGNLMYLHYHIGWRFSRLQPVRAEINVYSPDLPGVPPGHYTCEPLDELAMLNLKGYAFLVSFPFELLMPFPRKDLLMAPLGPANPPQATSPPQPAAPQP